MCLALWLVLSGAPAGPASVLVEAGFQVFERDGVRVAVAASGDARVRAERVRARYERAVEAVRANLGLAPQAGACVVACGARRQLRKVVELLAGSAPPDYAEAIAIPAMRTVVISPASDPLADKALAHETAHLALHARFARIPRWLDEGLAQWAAGQVPADRELRNLRHWAFRNGVIPFASLAEELPRRHDLAAFAYVQSFSVVAYLVVLRGGVERILDLLARAQDAPLAAAWEEIYGETAEATWERWRRHEARRFSVAAFLLRDIPLFTYLAVVLLIAYARYLVQRRRYLAAEDAGGPAPGGAEDDAGAEDAAGC
ncbi:MAG TPA: hypothetical protein DCM87_13470 [Planctomycetes bacterium]|nr:hypothetical protein [Planctomycetota bacterium]